MNTSTSSAKVQTAFRFNVDLIERLKVRAKRENRSLNNYVEKVLMDIVYAEPNEETIAATQLSLEGQGLVAGACDAGEPFEPVKIGWLEGLCLVRTVCGVGRPFERKLGCGSFLCGREFGGGETFAAFGPRILRFCGHDECGGFGQRRQWVVREMQNDGRTHSPRRKLRCFECAN